MTAAQLRQSILQAAVQGKLVPQNAHDEPASVLLERIRVEKAKLIKQGKIKKDKPLPPITEDEVPYDLPEGWVWCRLGEFCGFKNGISKRHAIVGEERIVLRLADIENFSFTVNKARKINVTDDEIALFSICENDLALIRVNGSKNNVARLVLFENIEDECLICDHLMRVTVPKLLSKKYIQILFNSNVLRKAIDEVIITTAGQHTINQKNLSSLYTPIPPLAEQQRIVAKVDELMASCDELEDAEKELATLESDFTEHLPKSILQAAVQGKLVPQNVHDEPASVLLERIRTEKAKLIKQGKIKKEKSLPPITEDEVPYDLPAGWMWCRLGEIVSKVGAGSTPTGGRNVYRTEGIKFLRSQNIYNAELVLHNVAFITEAMHEKMKNSAVCSCDVLLNITGASIGRCCIVPENFDTANINQHVSIIRAINADVRCFMHLYIISPILQKWIMDVQVGVSREGLSGEKIKSLAIPLPPLTEQQRIVAKVDELMALCNELKTADTLPIAPASSATMIPFPARVTAPEKPAVEEEYLIAARGDMQNLSAEAANDIDELLNSNADS